MPNAINNFNGASLMDGKARLIQTQHAALMQSEFGFSEEPVNLTFYQRYMTLEAPGLWGNCECKFLGRP